MPGRLTSPLMPTNFIPAAPFLPCALNQSDAAHQNDRRESKRLDVVDDGRLVPKAIRARKGRLVARLGALAFDGFKQRGFFAADIAAGADEDFKIEIEIAAQNVLAEQSSR